MQWSICQAPALFTVAVGLDISFCTFFLQNTTMQFQVCIRTAEGLSLLRKRCNVVITIFFFVFVLLTMHPWIILQIKPTWWVIFRSMFISFLYMFRVTIYPSSGELTVSVRHLVFVTLYGWNSFHPSYQTVIHTEWQIPSVAQIQLVLLMMGT
jgi:hypothetical protein